MQNVAVRRPVGKLVLDARDADQISETVSRVIAPVRVRPVPASRSVEYRSEFLSWSDFAISKGGTSTGMVLEHLTEPDIIFCMIPRSGLALIDLGQETIESHRNVIHVLSARSMRSVTISPGRRQFFFVTSIAAVEQRLSQTLGRTVKLLKDVNLTLDARVPSGSAMVNFASVIISSMRYIPQFDVHDIMMRRCRDAFVDLLCGALGAEQLAELTCRDGLLSLSYVRDAENFMEQNCHKPIGVSEVAAHLSVSIRTLQHAFKRHRDRSPLDTLTLFRLTRARDEIAANPEARLVDVAGAWGFVHLGRFAAVFRQRFGETPRELRARMRRSAGLDGG